MTRRCERSGEPQERSDWISGWEENQNPQFCCFLIRPDLNKLSLGFIRPPCCEWWHNTYWTLKESIRKEAVKERSMIKKGEGRGCSPYGLSWSRVNKQKSVLQLSQIELSQQIKFITPTVPLTRCHQAAWVMPRNPNDSRGRDLREAEYDFYSRWRGTSEWKIKASILLLPQVLSGRTQQRFYQI